MSTTSLLLHKILHYCFGAVAGSIWSLLVYVFFLELRLESLYKHSNFLSKQDQQLWLDAVLLPALDALVPAARMKYYPHSEDIAAIDITTSSKEALRAKDSLREQILPLTLRAEHLDRPWTSVLERIAEDLGLSRFAGATLFVNANNTKLAYMEEPGVDMATTYRAWERAWNEVADPHFYSSCQRCCSDGLDAVKTVNYNGTNHPADKRSAQREWQCVCAVYKQPLIHSR